MSKRVSEMTEGQRLKERETQRRYETRRRASRTVEQKATSSAWFRSHKLYKRYGITREVYEDLWASQDGLCAICQSIIEIYDQSRKRTARIDHDHKTGHVRGLLCAKCNSGIGMLNDDPVLLARAIVYLERGHV